MQHMRVTQHAVLWYLSNHNDAKYTTQSTTPNQINLQGNRHSSTADCVRVCLSISSELCKQASTHNSIFCQQGNAGHHMIRLKQHSSVACFSVVRFHAFRLSLLADCTAVDCSCSTVEMGEEIARTIASGPAGLGQTVLRGCTLDKYWTGSAAGFTYMQCPTAFR